MSDAGATGTTRALAIHGPPELSDSSQKRRSVRSDSSKQWQPPEGLLPNLKNPSRPTKRVFLPAGQMDLPGALLFWAKEHGQADHEPLFFSRKHARNGGSRAISRQQAWEIVRSASERANVRVLALRTSRYGATGEPAPVHPHLLRHPRVRQIMRATKSLPIAQKQAGWSRLQMAYLSVTDNEVREAMRTVEH